MSGFWKEICSVLDLANYLDVFFFNFQNSRWTTEQVSNLAIVITHEKIQAVIVFYQATDLLPEFGD